MVVTVPGAMAPARQATPKRAPRPPSGRCERHAPQTVMISKTPLRSGSPLRVLVELGTVGRCALAESCRTAARSNGDIGQSENPQFRFIAAPIKPSRPSCRIYRRDFTEFFSGVISALGYLPLWGNSRFCLRVRSLPGVSPKPPFGLILDSTAFILGRSLPVKRSGGYSKARPRCASLPPAS